MNSATNTAETDEQIDDFLADCGPSGDYRHTTTGDLLALATEAADAWKGAPEPARQAMIAALQEAARKVAALEMHLV